jgi:AAA domain
MMQLARRTSLVVALLLAFVGTASAECAWDVRASIVDHPVRDSLGDFVGYAHLFGLEPPRVDDRRYHDRVFVLPAWREIYATDDERKMTFEMAEAFGEDVRRIYEGLGYEIVNVPKDTPDARALFIMGA